MRGFDEFEEAVRAAVRPRHTEIIRAKQHVRSLIADGEAHSIDALQAALLHAENVPDLAREERVTATSGGIDRASLMADPVIRWHRLALAGAEAVVELNSLGLLVEVANPSTPGHPLIGAGIIRVPYQFGNQGGGVSVQSEMPNFASGYRLAPRYREQAREWFVDPDIFIADLEALGLEVRTRRAIVEALESFRRGLYLGVANLLGAASEGAWYSAGERLRALDQQLAKALDENRTVKVIERVSQVLRQSGGLKAEVPGLQAHAEILRQLRNYGAHPRDEGTDHLERYLTEASSGHLLLQTHSYLTRLGAAVERRLADETAALS